MKLIERLGRNEHGSEVVKICGQDALIHEYDWYMERALNQLLMAVNARGEVKFASVDGRFVHRFRQAIRENYNHGHNVPDTGFKTLREIISFVAIIERIEELQARGLTRR